MNKMEKHFSLVLLCLLMVSVSWADNPDAFELLDKFAVTQETTKSFILMMEVHRKGKVRYWNNVPMESFTTSEVRSDGKRYADRDISWGFINPNMILEKDEANYSSFLWDGVDSYQYSIAADEKTGHLIIRQYSGDYDKVSPLGKPKMATSYISTVRGYLRDSENINEIFRKASSVFVRDKMDKVGESSCYVIEARAQSGQYKVWIDPGHSYQIAKAEVKRGPGDIIFDSKYKLGENDHIRSFIKIVHFEKKGDVWIPIRWKTGLSRRTPDGGYSTQSTDFNITEFELNPDHELLKSFVPNDIPDGTIVRIGKGGEKDLQRKRYSWKDGKVSKKSEGGSVKKKAPGI